MTDRLLTLRDLLAPGPRPGLYELRVLERGLRRRIAALDGRVDELLLLDGAPTDAQVGEVDVLCAAIAEARELLDEARAEVAALTQHHRRRRAAPRRWL
jgi:hypothetical protein